jgi:hypothetical protein
VQTSIAQAAALTIFGNGVLSGHKTQDFKTQGFWPASSVFAFCRHVRFADYDAAASPPTESPFADDPVQWISRLKDKGTLALRLHHVPRNDPKISDRMSSGFVGGGGRWLIESMDAELSDIWEAAWRIGDKEDPARKIWDVTYYRVQAGRAHVPLQTIDLVALRNELNSTLSGIEAFATRQELNYFAGAFRKARDILDSNDPLADTYHSDLVSDPAMSIEARQLLGAAQTAWVFGGMGSWNDVSFDADHQHEYDELSERLFALSIQAVCGAVNSIVADTGGVGR